MHLLKQTPFAAVAVLSTFLTIVPQAHADTILNFTFTAQNLEAAIQNNESGYTGYSQSAYFAVFLQPDLTQSYTYQTETPPNDLSANIQFTGGTYQSVANNQANFPQPEGSACGGVSQPACDTSEYIVFSKGTAAGSVMLIGDPSLTQVAALVGGSVGANNAAPVFWGSQAQTIGGLYANTAQFGFSIDYGNNPVPTSIDFNGYVSAIEKGLPGTYKRTSGIEINMEFAETSPNSFSAAPEPSAGVLCGILFAAAALGKIFQRRAKTAMR